jgi:hypothetical protein
MSIATTLVPTLLALADAGAAAGCPSERVSLGWEAIRDERLKLWRRDHPDLAAIRELLACELATAREVVRTRPELGLAPVCIPWEVDFHLCNEVRPEDGCSEAALERYVDEGCLADPYEHLRHHRMNAMFWRRRIDFVRAERHLDEAMTHLRALRLRQLQLPDERPAMGPERLRLEEAILASERTELAALLHDGPAMTHHIAEVAALLPGLSEERWAGTVATIQNQVGWSLLLAHESGLAVGDPGEWLRPAFAGFNAGPGRNPRQAGNVRINLALLELQRSTDVEPALAWIADVDELSLSAEELLWLDLIRVRAEARAGRFAAAHAWHARMTRRRDVARVPLADWYVAQARGELLEATDPARAEAAYAAAEAATEGHALASGVTSFGPLADGRYAFFAVATRRLVTLQQNSYPGLAASTARLARNRATRIATRARCGRDGEAPPLAPGELRLLFTRTGGRGVEATWTGFAITADRVVARELRPGEVPDDLYQASEAVLRKWSEQLLVPFADAIDAAERVVVLPSEALHAVPFHALPWDDGLLIDAVPVAYGLDWEGCAAGEGTADGSTTLILAGDSPRLVAEGSDVSKLLRDADRAVTQVTVREAEDVAPLLSGGFTVAHVAAHGDHVAAASLLDSDDRLLFTAELWLTRDEILAAPRVPQLVFLSACRSSFIDTERLGGGISVAHAFLLRGARAVVGSTHDLDDRVASVFARRFHAGLADGDPGEAPYAWQDAFVQVRRETAPSQHPSLRMLRLYVR